MKPGRMGIVTGFVLALTLGLFGYPAATLAFEIEIDVAPDVLNIQSHSVVVTVHTDIAYSTVVGTTVFLNGVAINHWKSDARGNFVAKFLSDDIKTLDGLIIGDYNELVLIGYDIDGEAFAGTQEIMVIDVLPQGKN